MAGKSTVTWKRSDILEITNVSSENFLLELPSGSQRLDAGRTQRFTGSILDLPQVVTLVNSGKLKVEHWKRKK
jgi:uncharacterized protein (DUF1015 family)